MSDIVRVEREDAVNATCIGALGRRGRGKRGASRRHSHCVTFPRSRVTPFEQPFLFTSYIVKTCLAQTLLLQSSSPLRASSVRMASLLGSIPRSSARDPDACSSYCLTAVVTGGGTGIG